MKSLLDNQEAIVLIDVRENFEHAAFNIGGINIPLSEITSRSGDLDQTVPWVFYCEKGIRSVIAIQKLKQKFAQVSMINLSGGMQAWKKAFDY